MTALVRLPARSLVTAPRLPARPKAYGHDPFSTVGDVVADCDQPGCNWHAMGPRSLVGKAIRDHNRQFHASALLPSVTLLNHPRQ